MEVQLRTKDMDDVAEIGSANHLSYEKKQFLIRKVQNKIQTLKKGELVPYESISTL